MTIPVPSFPVIRSTLRDDATGELVVNGTSFPLSADSLEHLRRGVIAYTAKTARQFGRPVRLHATEPGGATFDVAVNPDGFVQAVGVANSVEEISEGQDRLIEEGPCRACSGDADVSENFCAWCGTVDPLSAILTPGERA